MKRFILALVLGAFSLSAQSALIDRGGGFIYDDVLDITWTQDANMNGIDTWANQIAWAESLSLYDSDRDVTWDDWRLAGMDLNVDTAIIDCFVSSELECRDNELGYMFHQNGVTSSLSGLFSNVQGTNYWSSTESSLAIDEAWIFHFQNGGQNTGWQPYTNYAWAVRNGDVAAVPIPAAVWLFGSALGLLGWMQRRRNPCHR